MGVQGLWPIIQPTAQHTPLDELRGLRLAIDLAIWVVDDMQTQREAACVIPGRLHLRNLLFRTLHLLKLGARPIFIVDGQAPLLKVQTMTARAQLHSVKGKSAASTENTVAPPPADPDRVRKRARFRQLLRGDCCRLLDLLGVPHVESPGEAESMAALLSSRGIVDAVITNDGDAFLYGAVRVLRNFSMDSRDAHVDWFDSVRLASQLGLSRDRLVALALLLGCDYAPGGTPGVGPALALKFFSRLPPDADATNWLLEAAAGGRSADSDGCGVLRRFLASSSTSTAAPAIVAEFLEANRAWPTVDPDRVAWRRPRALELVRFCLDRLEWAEDYTIAKLLPLLLVWDETAANSAAAVGPRPHRILAERVRSGVPCYEVEFSKLEFDIWTAPEFYTLCVPRHPFGQLHCDLVADFEQLRVQEKENKQNAKKLQKQQKKKTQQRSEKQKQKPMANQVNKIEDFLLPQPQPAAIGLRRSVLVDSLSDLFADISLASPAADSDLRQPDTKTEFVDNGRQPFSHLFDFHHRKRLSMSHCQFRLDTSLLDDSPKIPAASLRDRAATDPVAATLATKSDPCSESSSPVLSLASAFECALTAASAQASGSTSVHASGSTSVHASGSTSVHASGSAFAHASGSAPAHASAPVSAYAPAPVSAYAPAPVSAYAPAPVSTRQPLKPHLDDSFDKFKTPPRLATRLQLLYNCNAACQNAVRKSSLLE